MNLQEAEHPYLEFDLEFWQGRSYVVVAAQRSPDDRLVPLEVLDVEEVGLREWTHVTVPLHDYVGSTPRVVVFVHNSTAFDVLLKGVPGTEDGDPLPGDFLGSGDLERDGWEVGYFETFDDLVGRYSSWEISPLITGSGDVDIRDSRVLSSPGLSRDWREYRPQGGDKEGMGPFATVWTTPKNGGINMTGDLRIERSVVSYVPIAVSWGEVELLDTSFVGDCEVLTIAGTTGRIEGCDLSFKEGDGHWDYRGNLDDTWLLALERIGTTFVINDCTFSGEGIGVGLHLNRAAFGLSGCTFSDLGVGLWVHEAKAGTGWGTIDTEAFEDSCDLYYLETQECTAEYDGPEEPPDYETYAAWLSDKSIYTVPDVEGLHTTEYMTAHFSEFSLPLLVVGPDIGEVEVEEVRVRIYLGWVQARYLTLDPRVRWVPIWLEDEDVPVPSSMFDYFYSIDHDVGAEAGVMEQILSFGYDPSIFVRPYLNISMDGEQVDRLYLEDLGVNVSQSHVNVSLTHNIPPGPHNLTVSLAVAWYELEEYILELDNVTVFVYRVTGNESWEEVVDWLEHRAPEIADSQPWWTPTSLSGR